MEDIKIIFGKKIKELRIKMKMSQEELAEKIDIAERNLSKIECGKSFIRAEKIAKLADTISDWYPNVKSLSNDERELIEV